MQEGKKKGRRLMLRKKLWMVALSAASRGSAEVVLGKGRAITSARFKFKKWANLLPDGAELNWAGET